MKLPTLILSIIPALTFSLQAQVSPIRMNIEQISKNTPDPKDKTHSSKTQTRSLKILLNNNSTDTFDGLAVKYWFLGRTAGDSTTKILSEGERKSVLAPRGKDVVESETLSKQSVDEHFETAKTGAKTGAKPTKVPASGDKISGYAVRVMKDGKVLAEYYSEPSYKDIVSKPGAAAPAAAPGAKQAKK